jgi:selenocysteine lyase/cysteine desulfurase
MDAMERAIERLRRALVGRGARIDTPFGSRVLCHADLTATGTLLEPVERWIGDVAPYYANSHTLISSTGAAMTAYREEARASIARAVRAGPDDVVIFIGSGATAAVNKLVGVLGLRISDPLDDRYLLSSRIPANERPVVFVGPYEHHSNELPWVESVAEVVETDLAADGSIDLADLEAKLRAHAGRPLKIGSFSACSNVTGVLSDVRAIARLLHAHGALAFFDYAAAGPYVPIDMHPSEGERIDALFLSPHKFVGGPQSSGILVACRSCFRSRAPERPGGGTVDYVAGARRDAVDYLGRIEEREEGGTPAILGDLRAAAAFLIKEELGPERILARELATARAALERLSRHRRVRILGPLDLPRLPIIALNVEGLHHDLVSALLDHLFGIQNRAGCACAGPYGHRLLGIDQVTSERYRAWIARGVLGVKPGWVRVSLPYFAGEEEIDFILSAIEFIAEEGDAFVPLYSLNWRDGVWRHRQWRGKGCPTPPLTAQAIWSARGRGAAAPDDRQVAEERRCYLAEALRIARDLRKRWEGERPVLGGGTGNADLDALVWFRYAESEEPPGGA